jgi:hypothetical protein
VPLSQQSLDSEEDCRSLSVSWRAGNHGTGALQQVLLTRVRSHTVSIEGIYKCRVPLQSPTIILSTHLKKHVSPPGRNKGEGRSSKRGDARDICAFESLETWCVPDDHNRNKAHSSVRTTQKCRRREERVSAKTCREQERRQTILHLCMHTYTYQIPWCSLRDEYAKAKRQRNFVRR